MLAALTRLALNRRFLVILFSLLLAAIGVWSFSELKVEAYPDLSDPQVTVITQYPGYAPEEVEQQITIPIERALTGVPGVIGRRSRTIFGLSVVDLTFEYDADLYRARQLVLERLRDADLPPGVEPSLAPPTTPAGELYRYVLESDRLDQRELREIQDWVIAPRLMQVPGVGDVFAFGGLVKQYEIAVDPMALYKYGLSIRQVAEAVAVNNENAGGSLIRSGEQALAVRGIGRLRGLGDIENVVVAAGDGAPVFVRDVARVRVSHEPPTGIFGLNETSGLVEGIVAMRRGENASETLRGIRAAVEELNSGGLPADVRIRPIYDRTELVSNTLRTISRTLAEGFAVVFLVLLFFLGSLRAAVLTAIIVPLSLLFAFLAMRLFGLTASLLSLGAVDFGIIVDGTLVMVECMLRRLRQAGQAEGSDPRSVLCDAALSIQRPILFSLIILITAYLPLFTLERVERRLFMPMAFTIVAALSGALLFTMTLVPALASYLLPGSRPWNNPLLAWLTGRYERDLRFLLRHGRWVAVATAVLIVITAVLAAGLGTEFLPQLDEGVIWVRVVLPPGSSLERSAEVADRLRELARKSPEVLLVSSQTGRQTSNTEPFGPNRIELLIGLRPYSEWPPGKRKSDLVRELSERFRTHVPGAAFNFTQPISDLVMEAVTGSSADLAVLLSGPDLRVLRAAAAQTLELLRQIRGAADTAIEQEGEQAQVRIRLDRLQAARYGINASDLQQVIELAIGGRPVSTMFEGDRRFDIVVRYVPEARGTLADIGQILVPTANGGRVPLSQVAAIEVADGATIIARRENRRLISVRTNIRGRDQGSFVAEAQRKFREGVKLPPGYQVEWGGQFENLDRARRRLAWILPFTVVIIFGLLYWTFGSVRDALMVLTVIPFSVVGGILALRIRGMPFSVSAAVGFVALFGVAVMSGVLYISEINRLLRQQRRALEEAVLEGARIQLRPRLMLLTVAMLGIIPAALATGIGSDVQRPLATVVLGGLASTLAFTLLALPALYYLVRRGRATG
ncbi:MAG: CusA/CzcA family heavy metal efflux RND transporter [Bryobacteraceae bacterium]|nr:CusA/CzcA family heavy metal efflux RND transporter [Bryobacteraceae bacterium]